MNEFEKVPRYINTDLAYKSDDEKDGEFKVKVPELNDFIAELEFALMFLNFRDTPMFFETSGEHEFHLKTFDGAILNTKHLIDEKADLKFLNPFTTDISDFNSKLVENINVKVFDFNHGGNEKQKLFQVRKVSQDKIRNNKDLQGQKVFEFRASLLHQSEKWYSYGKHYKSCYIKYHDKPLEIMYPTTISNGHFIPADQIKSYMASDAYMQDLRAYYMAVSTALTSYYEWFVYIRENENSIGIKVPIRPESSKEIFALRNIEDGKRKKSICNFVREHLRLIPDNNYDENYRSVLVKEHLRGQSKFNWRGLEVHVIPAQYDLNRLQPKKKFKNI